LIGLHFFDDSIDSSQNNISWTQTMTTTMSRCFSFILLLALHAQADTLLGRVVSVADGDTITILDDTNTQHKIRLTGIDAPEKRQAFGNVSAVNDKVLREFTVAPPWCWPAQPERLPARRVGSAHEADY
jgi:endonuclease YncB( thermonuclease family)